MPQNDNLFIIISSIVIVISIFSLDLSVFVHPRKMPFLFPFYILLIISFFYPNKIWKRFLQELVLVWWQEESEVRFCAVRWATSLFDFQHCPSRFICMLGASDAKLDIRYNKFLLQCAYMLWWAKTHLKGFCFKGLGSFG